MKFGLAEFFC